MTRDAVVRKLAGWLIEDAAEDVAEVDIWTHPQSDWTGVERADVRFAVAEIASEAMRMLGTTVAEGDV